MHGSPSFVSPAKYVSGALTKIQTRWDINIKVRRQASESYRPPQLLPVRQTSARLQLLLGDLWVTMEMTFRHQELALVRDFW